MSDEIENLHSLDGGMLKPVHGSPKQTQFPTAESRAMKMMLVDVAQLSGSSHFASPGGWLV